MANGRMINHAITKDRRVNQLSDDTSRLAFTWLITFADREGRTYGDPAIVRSMLFPRREDISVARMTEYIQEWHDVGLVVWYEAQDDKFIFFPAFDKNQPGMRKERESASIIPPPPGINDNQTPEVCRSNDGVTPELSRIKLKEVKLKEWKLKEYPTTPKEAMNDPAIVIFHEASQVWPGRNEYQFVIDSIRVLKDRYDDVDSMIGDLARYAMAWQNPNRKTKDGKPYKITNPGWLEWAINQNIPPIGSNGKEPFKDTKVWSEEC